MSDDFLGSRTSRIRHSELPPERSPAIHRHLGTADRRCRTTSRSYPYPPDTSTSDHLRRGFEAHPHKRRNWIDPMRTLNNARSPQREQTTRNAPQRAAASSSTDGLETVCV